MNTRHYRFIDMEDQGLLSDSPVFSASAEPADAGILTAASFSPTPFLSFQYSFTVLKIGRAHV